MRGAVASFSERGYTSSMGWRRRFLVRTGCALGVIAAALAWSAWRAAAFAPGPPPRADVAIVLGASTWKSRPSAIYQKRIDCAVRLYREGRVSSLLFTGRATFPGERSCGEAGARAAIAAGVPAARVRYEDRSRTTRENLLVARQLLRARGARTAVVVSDPLHLRRALAMARDLAMDAAPAAVPDSAIPALLGTTRFAIREGYFWWQYFLVERFLAEPAAAAEKEVGHAG